MSFPWSRDRSDVYAQLSALFARAQPGQTVIPNATWNQAPWFIDPQNSTGKASDNNSGLTRASPVKTWNGGVIAKYQTLAPILRQNTTWTFLSNHTDDSDPVVFYPTIAGSSNGVMQGTLVAVGAPVVLANVTAKNRATPQLLQANLGPAAAVGMLVVNTTRAGSRAWVYKNVAGNVFSLTQPATPATASAAFVLPSEVDTWANGDAVQLYTPTSVNVAELWAVWSTQGFTITGGGLAPMMLYNLSVLDPNGAGADPISLNETAMLECSVNRALNGPVRAYPTGIVNCALNGSTVGLTGETQMFFGYLGGESTEGLNNWVFDGDAIIAVGVASCVGDNADAATTVIGLCYIDTGNILQLGGSTVVTSAFGGGNGIIWGPGSMDVAGRCIYNTAQSAQDTFLLTGGMSLGGVGTAYSTNNGNNPAVLNGNITLTAAHLDAAQGIAGFGGFAFDLAGASMRSANGF